VEISELTLRLILLVFPGAIGALIVETLTIHKPWNSFRFVLYASFLGLASYTLLQAVSPQELNFWAALANKTKEISYKEIFQACSASAILSFCVSGVIKVRLINRLAGRFRLSDKYGDDSLYMHFLALQKVEWITVRDKAQKLTYVGKVDSFNEAGATRELVLVEATVYETDTSARLYDAENILLAFKAENVIIEVNPSIEKGEANNG
jgi:hypothetical protein